MPIKYSLLTYSVTEVPVSVAAAGGLPHDLSVKVLESVLLLFRLWLRLRGCSYRPWWMRCLKVESHPILRIYPCITWHCQSYFFFNQHLFVSLKYFWGIIIYHLLEFVLDTKMYPFFTYLRKKNENWKASLYLYTNVASLVFGDFSFYGIWEFLIHWFLDCHVGTSVVQVTATDADDPTYGNSARVVYSILQGQPYFSVEPKTGKHWHVTLLVKSLFLSWHGINSFLIQCGWNWWHSIFIVPFSKCVPW